MLLRSFCNRLTQQDLVTCCAIGRAPPTVGHSRISLKKFDSKTNVSSKSGLLSRRRQKVAKLVVVRSASTDLVCTRHICCTSRTARRTSYVHVTIILLYMTAVSGIA